MNRLGKTAEVTFLRGSRYKRACYIWWLRNGGVFQCKGRNNDRQYFLIEIYNESGRFLGWINGNRYCCDRVLSEKLNAGQVWPVLRFGHIQVKVDEDSDVNGESIPGVNVRAIQGDHWDAGAIVVNDGTHYAKWVGNRWVAWS